MKHQHQSVTHRVLAAFAVGMMALATACTMKSQEAPPLTGPSELGLSITVSVSPDLLTQDGASQSLVTITARDSNGAPLRNVSLRAEISVGGVRADFGSLSARNLVTDNAGHASLIYTAPAATQGGAVDTGTVVDILVTPVGSDFGNSTPRLASIRLVPPGIILPPNGAPVPRFTFSPATASENVKIQFDASSSTDDGRIVSYNWTFGDGDSGTGVTISRAYSAAGTYNVTLTVTDDRGLSASTTQAVSIGTGVNPIAAFTVSPTPPVLGGTTRFDATLSSAAPGRRIVSYSWTFGDGGNATGVSPTHTFTTGGTFAVTLTVTDDIGKTGVSSQSLPVGTGGDPVASFTTSPATPAVNDTVFFNASGSTGSITSYSWNFGDGTTGSGVTTTHAYAAAATYTATLTVTDNGGRTSVTTQQITVTAAAGGALVASFTTSPAAPSVNETVFFNASASTGSITSYSWSFGDGTTGSGVTTTHAYAVAATYTVTLTVVDNTGRTNVTSKSVTVSSPAGGDPVASFTSSPAAPSVNETVFFNASGSTAPSGRTITSYSWNFGDGTVGSGVTTTHAYAAAATYTATLVVTDTAGRTNLTTRPLTIGASAGPTAALTVSPSTAVINSPVQAIGSNSTTQPGQTIVLYTFDFGDGRSDSIVSSASSTATHSYTATGTYTVTLTVRDSAGRTNTATGTVTIAANQVPIAVFTYSPNSPVPVGTAVTFNASQSQAPQNAVITRYEWTFGDSLTVYTTNGTTPTITHTYGAAGNYTVVLKVYDNQGGGPDPTRSPDPAVATRPISIQ